MQSVKVRVYKLGEDEPDTTVTIPGAVLRLATRLIPGRASVALREEGIDIEEIVRLAEQPDVRGTLVEVEDHVKGERVVIGLE